MKNLAIILVFLSALILLSGLMGTGCNFMCGQDVIVADRKDAAGNYYIVSSWDEWVEEVAEGGWIVYTVSFVVLSLGLAYISKKSS